MNNTNKQISNINRSLTWLKNHFPEQYENRFLELVALRRQLRKISKAQQEKPAIAAFGESQKGKSYLMGNLLQKQKSPFMVKNEKGELINFVDRVNPIGNDKEATGVVTRFTSFDEKRQPGRYMAQHPVIVKLFSVSDLATIICDSFYHDLSDTPIYADDDIKKIAEDIYNKYKDHSEVSSGIITEDDILDIKAYLEKYVKGAQALTRSGYFEKLALVICRVPSNEWSQVLKYLWHENPILTALFERLLNALRTLSYSKEVYVDFDAVMHLGENKNTIMSVDCLNGLDDKSWSLTTNVYVKKDGSVSVISGFPKCELCALCAETMVKIEPEFMEDVDSYYFTDSRANEPGCMPRSSRDRLPADVKKDLLNDTDLLDFPGARNRLAVKENFLETTDNNGVSNLVQMLLRGKVAFLFNNYSESRIINILLFCHDTQQPSVNEMYIMIDDWVQKYVGANASERKRTIDRCGGISPLFVVGTKFNIDMKEVASQDAINEAALNQRWDGRFIKILYTQSFKAESVDWFKNWDAQGNTFKNTYMLRDFKYSGCDGSGNNVYEGYDQNDPHPTESKLHLSPDFYHRLRDTFITNSNVAKFFENPELAWDAAATLNNDGALYIIQNLATVAKHMEANRAEQFDESVERLRGKLLAIMRDYYISDDTSELLRTNLRKAYGIFADLEFTCQNHPEYFGHLLYRLQLPEDKTFHKLHDLLPELPSKVNDNVKFANYEMIRTRCKNFEGCTSEEDKWKRLIQMYFLDGKDEAHVFLQKKGVDSEKLFAAPEVKKRNSSIITSDIIDFWRSCISSFEFINTFAGEGKLDGAVLNNLVKCIFDTAASVGLSTTIEDQISTYVDIQNINNINQELVSDLIATTISDFVTDMGYSYLTSEQINSARKVTEENMLPCFDWTDRERKEHYEEEEITALFNQILDIEGCYTESYMANYNTWLEKMFVAFIAHLNIPDFDRQANDKLKEIIDDIKKTD